MPNIYSTPQHIPAAEIRKPQSPVEVPREPPFVPDGWLSIRATIDTAGKALFGSEWTGNEVYARALPPLSGTTEDDLETCRQHRRGCFNLLNHPGDGLGETDPATIEEYVAECAAARRHFETIAWLRQRWWSGNLPVSRLDGKMHPVLQHQFADENFFHWVVRHASNPSGVGGHLLVQASDLAKTLESTTKPSAHEAPADNATATASDGVRIEEVGAPVVGAEASIAATSDAGLTDAAELTSAKPSRRNPRHDQWVAMAKVVKDEHREWGPSRIADHIYRQDSKSPDPRGRGQRRDVDTIRGVLSRRRAEWDLPMK